MDNKRKLADLPDAESCKKPKLDSTGNKPHILRHQQWNKFCFHSGTITEHLTALQEALNGNSSDEEDVAELANLYAEKCGRTGGNKVVKSDVEHLVLQYFDLGHTVVDEVALEGLDGITLEGEVEFLITIGFFIWQQIFLCALFLKLG